MLERITKTSAAVARPGERVAAAPGKQKRRRTKGLSGGERIQLMKNALFPHSARGDYRRISANQDAQQVADEET
jgi:hypothetical protein